MSFVRGPNPIWYMPDHVGEPLNDEYYALFLTNEFPYLPQNIYRDHEGQTTWPCNIVQFQPGGTLPNNLYFDPNLVYRIEIRHGSSQSDALIYEINDYVPCCSTSGGGDGSLSSFTLDNQITNGQFSFLDLNNSATITTAGTHTIAPGWDLILVGLGSTTITQLILSGSQGQPNNPPFAIRFANSGWTSATLRQRLNHNGALWAGGAISMSFAARAQGSPQALTMSYVPSAGTGFVNLSATLGTTDFVTYSSTVNLPASNNTDLSTVAHIDVIITLPPNGTVDITNIQLVGQSEPFDSSVVPPIAPYQQESQERQIDHTFHVYKNDLIQNPRQSLLTGWNFPLNPFQFTTTTVTTAATQTSYIADQTILHQEAASQVQTGKNSVGERQNLVVKGVVAAPTTRFALIQYIDPATIRPYWSYILSVLAKARIQTSHGTLVPLKCRLIYRAGLPSAISATEPISSWVGTDPTFAGGWTAIAPNNDPAYTLTSSYQSLAFNHFQLPTATNVNMTLGVVLYTTANLNVTGTTDAIYFDKVGLTPTLYAADALPETFDESLRRCQFYYEKSYDVGDLPGTATTNGLQFKVAQLNTNIGIVANQIIYRRSFEIDYQTVKRAAPAIEFYNAAGTSNRLTLEILSASGASIQAVDTQITPTFYSSNVSPAIALFAPSDVTALGVPEPYGEMYEGRTLFHYTADSRLGV